MPWFKVWTSILDEYKFQALNERQCWRYIQLLALAAVCDAEGFLVDGVAFTIPQISFRLHCKPESLEPDMQTLKLNRLIEYDEEMKSWYIPTFGERQGRTQIQKRQAWREYQDRHRKKLRLVEPVINDNPLKDQEEIKEERRGEERCINDKPFVINDKQIVINDKTERDISDIWERAMALLKSQANPYLLNQYKESIQGVRILEQDTQDALTFLVMVSDDKAREWLEQRCRATLQRTLTGITGKKSEVIFEIGGLK